MNASSHDHPLDDLATYAVDALDEPERREIERHLAGCASCRAELAAHHEVLAALAGDEAPPPTVWAGIERRIAATPRTPQAGPGDVVHPVAGTPGDPDADDPDAEAGGPVGGTPGDPGAGDPGAEAGGPGFRTVGPAGPAGRPTGEAPGWRPQAAGDGPARGPRHRRPADRRPRRRVLAGALAAAAVAVVLAAVGSVTLRTSGDDGVEDVAQRTLDDGDSRTSTLSDPDGQQVARVAVGDEGAYVLLDDLQALDEGQAYQMWTLDGPQPVSLGVLGDGASEVVPVAVPVTATSLAISVEPESGVVAPTGPIVATGDLSPA
jgi:anti-sigma-K factor RskA